MKEMKNKTNRTIFQAAVFITCCSLAGLVSAQQGASAEDLQKLLDQQKESLAEVEANREATEAQAQQVRDALAEQEKRKSKMEAEYEALCKEQEALKPGSYNDCMSDQ